MKSIITLLSLIAIATAIAGYCDGTAGALCAAMVILSVGAPMIGAWRPD